MLQQIGLQGILRSSLDELLRSFPGISKIGLQVNKVTCISIPLQDECFWGYTGFGLSVCICVRPCVCEKILVFCVADSTYNFTATALKICTNIGHLSKMCKM